MKPCLNPTASWRSLAAICLAFALGAHAATPGALDPDHFEFDAALVVPFASHAPNGARTFTLRFDYPGAKFMQLAVWQLTLRGPDGSVVRQWLGETAYNGRATTVSVPWEGLSPATREGIYSAELRATVADPILARTLPGNVDARVARVLAAARGHDLKRQRWEFVVGQPTKPAMPHFAGLPLARNPSAGHVGIRSVSATGTLPYTVYYGNLHSQTNDSDGGGAIGSCSSSQPAQTGQYGPADAYAYARNAGLDFLMTSEHNHYFDGSSGTNTSASAAAARSRYQAGLSAAANFNTQNAGFLALYGMEWGVISNGGHLNIFGSNELLAWEYNASNELLGDRYVAKSDYASLYTLMKQKGWLGQFNHPDPSGQFQINGTSLAYHPDGEEVMVLAEVLNTSAFSSNTSETETSRSNFEDAYKALLERGYRVAPASNQDNHCANWGRAYTNRTAVLIPSGTPITTQSFMDALRARRVFATMDKQSQLIVTANNRLMGERFDNTGPLTLTAHFASSAGRSVQQIEWLEGVPGRNGTVTPLATTPMVTITPTPGKHFYYARVVQDDGKLLLSAPVWVNQRSGGIMDTQPPAVTASTSGTAGTIALNAMASDDVGVARVEFYVDGALRGTLSAAPYTLNLDSATLGNGAHTLLVKAFDAAGNAGSASVGFTVSNPVADTQPPTVSASVTGSSGTITLSANATDNVGVTKVEFWIDNVLRGSVAQSPYTLRYDSTLLSNGTHSMLAKASDAAGNVGQSSAVSFAVNNTTTGTTMSETESNGTLASANAVPRTVNTITGTMGAATDKDYFAVSLKAGETVTVDMTGPSTTDYDLYVVDASDRTLVASEGDTSTERVRYTAGSRATTVYLLVASYRGYSRTTPYTLKLSAR